MEYAGLWRRIFAVILDWMIFRIVAIMLLIIINIISSSEQVYLTNINGAMDFIQIVYLLILPVIWSGFTIGKKMIGIRIEKVDKQSVNLWTMVKRELFPIFCIVSIPYFVLLIKSWVTKSIVSLYIIIDLTLVCIGVFILINLLLIIFREDKRSLFDLFGGTQVVLTDVNESDDIESTKKKEIFEKITDQKHFY